MMLVQAAASAFILTIASQCARNIAQTAGVRKQQAIADPTMNNPLSCISTESESSQQSPSDRLRTMKRKELLQVFAASRAPTPSELEEWFSSDDDDDENNKNKEYCEWDFALLNNHSVVMTAVASFFTHGLFGGIYLPWRLLGPSSRAKGQLHRKAFAKPTSSTAAGSGVNLFLGRDGDNNPSSFRRHPFDYNIVRSDLLPGENSLALRLTYERHQSLPISMWKSMQDELRVVDIPLSSSGSKENNKNNSIVLIGFGWMALGGGPLNSTPFLLERPRPS